MTRVFAADQPLLFAQDFQHVTIADFRPCELNAVSRKRHLKAVIGHLRTDHTTAQFATRFAVRCDDEDELIAVVQITVGIRHQQAIRVAVERNANVGLILYHHRG